MPITVYIFENGGFLIMKFKLSAEESLLRKLKVDKTKF